MEVSNHYETFSYEKPQTGSMTLTRIPTTNSGARPLLPTIGFFIQRTSNETKIGGCSVGFGCGITPTSQ